ncbi:MAG: hypothetical protein UV74_C0013G0433 [Candidatus Woesebacteria bacterium GW2011_GWB1_43_14]|uniref:LytR/CpsA/Psr regulator C-terminal domain-containing protein n=1 Tax=Candidatus Woesebacteria bacterium GW2011_GWB1_43_14 TaxID=1618578 RepID=A0A0G1FQK0_9BACT|nr:MAG: hypothetical protein UT21_C0001G0145 [Candidatus Woesebacteria bacterium GW2011_GWA1_39_11b]KKS77510.1 MAG: seg [Candidatus Woesebacteria bacterium GW2011_GWC1_42_9]KKS97311.1 MAG: hypothetical protein UV74_C0013G0433 [Candidatus Woesebacteria bacterium GW2011_GWB1_43_14]
MEENPQQEYEKTSPQVVSFPSTIAGSKNKPKRSRGIIAILGVIIIVVVGGFLLLKFTGGSGSEDASPTPTTQGLSTFATPEPSEATPAPESKSKADVVIEVLNGTGKAGDAGIAKTKLEGLGYEQITTSNADSQEETITTITYDRELDDANIDAITSAIKEAFSEVKVKKASLSGGVDARIVTGPRIGADTSKATTSPSPTSIPTPTSSPGTSPSPSPTGN